MLAEDVPSPTLRGRLGIEKRGSESVNLFRFLPAQVPRSGQFGAELHFPLDNIRKTDVVLAQRTSKRLLKSSGRRFLRVLLALATSARGAVRRPY